MKKKFSSFFLIILVLSIFFKGCYNYKYVEANSNYSDKIVDYKYDIIKIEDPTKENPIVAFKLIRYPVLQKVNIITLKEVVSFSSVKTALLLVSSGLGLLTIGGIMVALDEQNLGTAGTIIAVSGLLTSTYGFLGASSRKDTSYFTGNVKDTIITLGDTFLGKDYESVYNENPKLILSINSKTFSFSPTSGIYKVNLVSDLGLIRFNKPQVITINVTLTGHNVNKNFKLNTELWSEKFIKIKFDQVNMYDNEGIIVGVLNYGEEHKLIFMSEEMWEIDYKGQLRYIEPNSGEIFWAYPKFIKDK